MVLAQPTAAALAAVATQWRARHALTRCCGGASATALGTAALGAAALDAAAWANALGAAAHSADALSEWRDRTRAVVKL